MDVANILSYCLGSASLIALMRAGSVAIDVPLFWSEQSTHARDRKKEYLISGKYSVFQNIYSVMPIIIDRMSDQLVDILQALLVYPYQSRY